MTPASPGTFQPAPAPLPLPSAHHAERLYAVVAALSETLSAEQVGAVVVREGVAALAADRGVLALLREGEERLEIVSSVGYPAGVFDQDAGLRLDSGRPMAEVARTGRPTWLETPQQAVREYPALAPILQRSQSNALASVPLTADGRILGVLGVSYDAPHTFDAAERGFFYALASQCAQALERARLFAALQEEIKVRDDFLAAASHDLKNPLAAVQGTAQMLERTLARRGDAPPDRLKEGLSNITAAVGQMTSQINELLDVARLRMGRPLPLELRPADLVELAHRITAFHQTSTERHTLRVTSTVPHLVGQWDGLRLERVLSNLLSNAIKYSPDGGEILIQIDLERNTSGNIGGTAVMRVRDSGMGIPAADLPRVFERFQRGANVLGRVEGTGIGLAASRQVVIEHGGSVDVESEEGQGSTFTVRLPLAPPAAPAQSLS